VYLEALAPSLWYFSILGQTLEYLVEVAFDVVAHGNHRAVDERDACTPFQRHGAS